MAQLVPSDAHCVLDLLNRSATYVEENSCLSSHLLAPLHYLFASIVSIANSPLYFFRGSALCVTHLFNLDGSQNMAEVKQDMAAASQSLFMGIIGVITAIAGIFSPSLLMVNLKQSSDEAQQRIAELEEELREHEIQSSEEEERFTRERDALQNRVTCLGDSIRRIQDSQAELQVVTAESQRLLREHEVQFSEREERLTRQRNALQFQVSRLERSLESNQGICDEFQILLQGENQRLRACEVQLTELSRERDNLENQVAQLNKEKEALYRLCETYKQNNQMSKEDDEGLQRKTKQRKARTLPKLRKKKSSSALKLEEPSGLSEQEQKVILDVIERLHNYANIEGIWRVSGDIQKAKELRQELNNQKKSLEEINDGHLLVTIAKQYLSDLGPLISVELTGNIDDDKKAFQEGLDSLSPISKKIVTSLVNFFQEVEKNKETSLMDFDNIAKVLAPRFFPPDINLLQTQQALTMELLTDPTAYGILL